jgi:hypothetical protein
MTATELMAKLEKCPPDTPVKILRDEDYGESDVFEIDDVSVVDAELVMGTDGIPGPRCHRGPGPRKMLLIAVSSIH